MTGDDQVVEVRAAVVGDAEIIAAINAAGWRHGFAGLISEAYLSSYDGRPQLRQDTLAHPDPDDVQLVAVSGDDVVGWLSGGPAQEDDLGPEAYAVRACYVLPDHWRTGVGRLLMATLVTRLDPERWTHLVLWTLRDATASRAFYESIGMVHDGTEMLLDLGEPVPAVRFSAAVELLGRHPIGRRGRVRIGARVGRSCNAPET